MLHFSICALDGSTVREVDDPLAGSNVVTPLNGRISGTLNLSFDEPAAAEVTQPLARIVKCWLDGDIIACGPILKPRFDMQARQVTVPFFGDPSYRLEKSFVNNRGDTDFNTGTGLLYALDSDGRSHIEGRDQVQILIDLINHARPTALELSLGVPDLGLTVGFSQSGGILRDRTYETGAQVYQQIVDMSGVIDGVDFGFTPVDRTDGTLAAFETWYPQRGEDKSAEIVFECGMGLDNAANVIWEPAGDEVVNRATYQGVYTEGDPPLWYQSNQAESQLIYGIYQNYVGRSDVDQTTTLESLARDDAGAHAFPVDGFEITPALDDGTGRVRDPNTGGFRQLDGRYGQPPKIGPRNLWVGDTCGVRIFDRPAVAFEGAGRIYEITLTGDEDGKVIPQVKTTPSTIFVEAS